MKEKRELPRNVDGSFKIFSVMPLKNFLIAAPIVTGFGGMVLFKPHPLSLFIAGIGASATVVLGCEFQGETGYEILKSIIEYQKNGDITFDRSTDLVPIQRRFINREDNK